MSIIIIIKRMEQRKRMDSFNCMVVFNPKWFFLWLHKMCCAKVAKI